MSGAALQGRRVVFVTERNTLGRKAGNSRYLAHIARCLGEGGAALTYLAAEPPPPPRLRDRMPPDHLALFGRFEIRGTVRRGDAFYPLDPRNWAARASRRLGLTRPAPTFGVIDGPWRLDPPPVASRRWVARRLRALGPDIVIANYFNAGDFFEGLPPATLRVILVHDVMKLRGDSLREAGAPLNFDPGMIERERVAFADADLCLAIKRQEADYILAAAPGAETALAPFAAEIPDWPLDDAREPVCLFVGTNNHSNRDGLDWLLDAVWPRVRRLRPAARLRVVGGVAEQRMGGWPEGAEPVGFVADLDAEYRRAAVALTPLRFGSGVKIKLIEGLAAGLPSVATTVGAEGVDDAPPEALTVADDPAGFADAVAGRLDAPTADRRAAREFAATRFDRAAVGRALVSALRARHDDKRLG